MKIEGFKEVYIQISNACHCDRIIAYFFSKFCLIFMKICSADEICSAAMLHTELECLSVFGAGTIEAALVPRVDPAENYWSHYRARCALRTERSATGERSEPVAAAITKCPERVRQGSGGTAGLPQNFG